MSAAITLLAVAALLVKADREEGGLSRGIDDIRLEGRPMSLGGGGGGIGSDGRSSSQSSDSESSSLEREPFAALARPSLFGGVESIDEIVRCSAILLSPFHTTLLFTFTSEPEPDPAPIDDDKFDRGAIFGIGAPYRRLRGVPGDAATIAAPNRRIAGCFAVADETVPSPVWLAFSGGRVNNEEEANGIGWYGAGLRLNSIGLISLKFGRGGRLSVMDAGLSNIVESWVSHTMLSALSCSDRCWLFPDPTDPILCAKLSRCDRR